MRPFLVGADISARGGMKIYSIIFNVQMFIHVESSDKIKLKNKKISFYPDFFSRAIFVTDLI